VHVVGATDSLFLGLSAMLSFGIADFIAKILLSKTKALRTVLISQGIGTVLFVIVALSYGFVVPDTTTLYLTLVSGVISAVVIWSYYGALSLGKASLVAPIASCLNVVAVALSFLILGESLTGLQLFLIACVSVGIILAAFERPSEANSSRKLSILLALVVVFLGGGNVIIQKWIATGSQYLMGFFFTRIFMFSFLLPTTVLSPRTHSSPMARSYVKMGLLGLIDVSGFFAWYLGLHYGLVSIVTPIATSSPAVTVILAHLFLKERISLHQSIGIVAIITGITFLVMISQ